MERTYVDYIADMVDAGERAIRHLGGRDLAGLTTDELRIDALVRALTVMGEACKRIPSAVRIRFPDIPWKVIAGMRDVLVHAYDRVDLVRVWDTVTAQIPVALPALRAARATLVAEEPPLTEPP